MSKAAFDKIAAGLQEVMETAREGWPDAYIAAIRSHARPDGPGEQPVFEARLLDGTWLRIWLDGRIEGISHDIVINRIPALVNQAANHGEDAECRR